MIQKFRAWDKENKIMLVVDNICNLFWDSKFIECYKLVPDSKGKQEYELIDHRIDLDDAILMQSIGLTDKNGNKIFEGDIVKYKSSYKTFTEEVAYNKNLGGFGVMDVDTDTIFTFGELTKDIYLSSLEVVGNVYENPELLR